MTGGPPSSSPNHNWGSRPRRARGGAPADGSDPNHRGRPPFRQAYRPNRHRPAPPYHNRPAGPWQPRDIPMLPREPWNHPANNIINHNHPRFHGPLDDHRRGPPPHPDDILIQRRGPPSHLDDPQRRGPSSFTNYHEQHRPHRPPLSSPSSRHDGVSNASDNPLFRGNNRSPGARWNKNSGNSNSNLDRRHGGSVREYYNNHNPPPPQMSSNIPLHSRHNLHAPVPQRNAPPPFYDYKDEFRDGNRNNAKNNANYGIQPAAALRNNSTSKSPDNSGSYRRQHPGLSMPLGSASRNTPASKSSAPRFTSVNDDVDMPVTPRKFRSDDATSSTGSGIGIATAKPLESPPSTSRPIDLRNTLTRGSAEKRRDDIRAAAVSRRRSGSGNNDDTSPIHRPRINSDDADATPVPHTLPKASGSRRSTSSPRFTNIVPEAAAASTLTSTTPLFASTKNSSTKSSTTRFHSRWTKNTDAITPDSSKNRRRSYSPRAFTPMVNSTRNSGSNIGGNSNSNLAGARETRKIETRPASPPPVPTQPRPERSRATVSEGGGNSNSRRSRFHDVSKKRERRNQDESKRWGDVTINDVEMEKKRKDSAARASTKENDKKNKDPENETNPTTNAAVVPLTTSISTSSATMEKEKEKKNQDTFIKDRNKLPEKSNRIPAAEKKKSKTSTTDINTEKKEIAAVEEAEHNDSKLRSGEARSTEIEKDALDEKSTKASPKNASKHCEENRKQKKIELGEKMDTEKEERAKKKGKKEDAGDVDGMDRALKTMKVDDSKKNPPKATINDAKNTSKTAMDDAKNKRGKDENEPSSTSNKKSLARSEKFVRSPVTANNRPGRASSFKKKREEKQLAPAVLSVVAGAPSSFKGSKEIKQKRRPKSPKKRQRTKHGSPRFEDIAPSDLLLDNTNSREAAIELQVGDSQRKPVDKKSNEAQIEKKGGKSPDEKAVDGMDLGSDAEEKVEQVESLIASGNDNSNSTALKVPVIAPPPKLPLELIPGRVPSFNLRSKPRTPNSAPVSKSRAFFDSADSLGEKEPHARFLGKTLSSEMDTAKENTQDDAKRSKRNTNTAPKLLEEISAVDLEMKAIQKEIVQLKTRLAGLPPPVEDVDDDNENENRKFAREFCAKLIIDIEKRKQTRGEMFIVEPQPRSHTVFNDNIVKILDVNRVKARAANAEFNFLYYQPHAKTRRVLVEQQTKSCGESEVVEKVRNTIRRRRKEEREKVRTQVRGYRKLKESWAQNLVAKNNKTSKEKRDIARDRDRYLLVNTRGASALLTCKTSSGRTSTKVLPGLSGGNIVNVAEVDSMLADIEKFGGTPGTAEIVQRTLADIPNQNANHPPFDSNSLLIEDPIAELQACRARNFWTAQERLAFLNKYLIHQKNFKKIATFIPNKNTNDCVRFYFDNKLSYGLKGLLRDTAAMKRNGTRELTLLKMTGLPPTEHNLVLCGVPKDVSGSTAKQIAVLMGSPAQSIGEANRNIKCSRKSTNDSGEKKEGERHKIIGVMEKVQKTIERSASPGLGKPERNNINNVHVKETPVLGRKSASPSPSGSPRLSKAARNIERAASPRFGKTGKEKNTKKSAATSITFEPRTETNEGRSELETSEKGKKNNKMKGGMDREGSPGDDKLTSGSKSDKGIHNNQNKTASWTAEERGRVEALFKEHGREFKVVAQVMGTKTAAQVKGYWKKIFVHERHKGRKRHEHKSSNNNEARNHRKRDAAQAQLGYYNNNNSNEYSTEIVGKNEKGDGRIGSNKKIKKVIRENDKNKNYDSGTLNNNNNGERGAIGRDKDNNSNSMNDSKKKGAARKIVLDDDETDEDDGEVILKDNNKAINDMAP